MGSTKGLTQNETVIEDGPASRSDSKREPQAKAIRAGSLIGSSNRTPAEPYKV
jgi:hypothetical protein